MCQMTLLPVSRKTWISFRTLTLIQIINLLKKISLLRIFQSKEQKYKWEQITDIYKDSTVSCLACKKLGIISALGAGKTHAWKMKAKEFIKYSKTKLLSQNSYLAEPFIPEKWKDFRVIFCDGYRSTQNQWFKDLPFSPAQGELWTFIQVTSSMRAMALGI